MAYFEPTFPKGFYSFFLCYLLEKVYVEKRSFEYKIAYKKTSGSK